MDAEIIAVGSELLLGQIVNTNAKFLSQQFAEMGVNVFYHTVVGDNESRLTLALETAESRANLIVFTGGLGPTKDDLTKETISSHLGRKLVSDEEALDSIKAYFSKTGAEMTENNKKQALILEGSEVLPNDHGMAPGMVTTIKGITYMLLPGPPKEMEPMFLSYGFDSIMKKLETHERIESKVLRFFGIGESLLETKIEDLLEKQANPTIAPLAGDGEVTLRITAKDSSREKCEAMIAEVETEIISRVGEYYYGSNETSLIKELVKELTVRNLTIAGAESLTGGMFQEQLTSIPGAGKIFKGGIVSYTNDTKANLLKISDKTIDEYGVVSGQCAIEMAENVRDLLDADVGISFTGVAGPDEQEGMPVGTVFIGMAFRNQESKAERLNLSGSRAQNRIRSVKYGCHYLLRQLIE
ncbi:competence/damage-inducible protein A [Peribacillus cavernae]|uniref:Putative competence-damage inducible protein n=1 Tax=Peribacillus cavernae TaxID=1674310 RepID=A0A433HQF4_9BACI|nr:competence/damage-inducible protein A [Peribacillus cavernae]MDQ0217004.1 nicotinamide-nucleotide amidase [Peribacillus cavernae]RUQ30513.1 competence/damage-inducible protein A [Peribacillus cavernae]